ncbi:MAG: redox-regulated ATPase YchF [Candidatus Woesearchaeota archaeon]
MLIGVVGKPNVGKSTFFKALTLADVYIANFPFATIKPNSGVAYVRVENVDKEFNVKSTPRFGFNKGAFRFVPVQVMDVAGLVPGAHEGKGMGNQFLDDLRQADAFIHIVDAAGSTTISGEPVQPGSHDPCEDVEFLERELDMWYFQILNKGWERFAKIVTMEHADAIKAIAKQFTGLGADEDDFKEIIEKLKLNEIPIAKWSVEDLKNLASSLRRKTKPMIIAANKADYPNAEENIRRIKEKFPEYLVVPCSAESELALKEADARGLIEYVPGDSDFRIIDESRISEKQKRALEFIRENVLKRFGNTGVQNALDDAVFKLLGYIAVFPGGVHKLEDSEGRILPDCFLMPKNSTALDFAYKIHTDLGNNFITAIDVRSKKPVGKNYILKHRDVIEIVTSK